MAAFLLGVAWVIAILVEGFVLKTLWGWFVTRVFGIEPISIAAAIGLALIVGFFQPRQARKFDKEELARRLARGVGYAIITLAVGWVVQLFV